MRSDLLAASFAFCLVFLPAVADAAPLLFSAPSDLSCQKYISKLIKGSPRSETPGACWRVGPLILGMTEHDLDTVMGSPDQTTAILKSDIDSRAYTAKIYAFPKDWRSSLESRPQVDIRLRFVEVLLYQGRVVQIANNPGARVDGPNCDRTRHAPGVRLEGEPSGFPVFQQFAGIRTGMTVRQVSRLLGSTPNANRPGDWRSYLPTPIAFGVDPETQRIDGFEIATDDKAVTTGAAANLTIGRDPLTCRITRITFHSSDSPSP